MAGDPRVAARDGSPHGVRLLRRGSRAHPRPPLALRLSARERVGRPGGEERRDHPRPRPRISQSRPRRAGRADLGAPERRRPVADRGDREDRGRRMTRHAYRPRPAFVSVRNPGATDDAMRQPHLRASRAAFAATAIPAGLLAALLAALLPALLAPEARADTLTLNDGRVVEGRVTKDGETY